MKSLQINSDAFSAILVDFKNDLATRNVNPKGIYNIPNHIREFMHYLESKGHETLSGVTTKMVTAYYKYLSTRKNKTRGGALSNASLNKHQHALHLFLTYLKNNKAKITFGVHLKNEKPNTIDVKDILTQNEVVDLFDACKYSHVAERFRLRDKAILAVLYSCGLRRNEAVGLDISDIDFDKRQLYVRNGSRNKRRKISYVPVNDYNLQILKEYLESSRPQFYLVDQTEALFVSKNGDRLQGQSLANRLSAIVKASENEAILVKHITPHNLRHSVATHLLQRGMPIEKVKDFLGHKSLESTQIYVHIIEQLGDR
jgi:integrase/recombinase XerD